MAPVRDIPTTRPVVLAHVTVVLPEVVLTLVSMTPEMAEKVCAVLVAVAFTLRTKCVVSVTELTVALFGMPVPTITIPAVRPVVLVQVTFALPLVVAQLASTRLGLPTLMPAVNPVVLVQEMVELPLVRLQPERFTVVEP